MILLQTAADMSPILMFEAVIIVGVIVFQIYRTVVVYRATEVFKRIFSSRLFVRKAYLGGGNKLVFDKKNVDVDETANESDNSESEKKGAKKLKEITVTDTESTNETTIRIKDAINTYLANNYGAAVNFSIIKDIIDREVDIKDENISQSVQTPLYLGLAATMVGIILGLFAMPNIEGDSFTQGINALINGVKYAMGASLMGLLLTTFLSTFVYKNAKTKLEKEKSGQLSYLQAKLLPELLKAEETGVAGLKASLDTFSRQATEITDKVNESSVINNDSIRIQLEVLDRVEKLNMTKISKVNLELFDKLEKNVDSFREFSRYLKHMENISMNLRDFANRTSEVDNVIKQLNAYMHDSNALSKFLTSHFEKIESAGGAALKSVNLAESNFSDSIDKLQEEINNRIENLNKSANTHESHIKDIYVEIGNSIETIAKEHIDSFQEAYSDAVPKFDKLDELSKLSILEPIKSEIERENGLLKANNEQLVQHLTALNDINRNFKKDKKENENKGLESAINELSKQLTGKDSNEIQKKSVWNKIFGGLEMILRIIAWLAIISYAIHSLLKYFEILP